ncbi:hypothetical protein SADUNF_Sadunf08G0129000 [Salix dunnii]|uniref:Uncharacterized protein n=1 Tax=Salix dunnii TaxID=1413687 RepID=A0A835MUX5_9ROSI|nr:hypothetical protein SADUNF_Sadunf08G0129000 [Salix dunnii]
MLRAEKDTFLRTGDDVQLAPIRSGIGKYPRYGKFARKKAIATSSSRRDCASSYRALLSVEAASMILTSLLCRGKKRSCGSFPCPIPRKDFCVSVQFHDFKIPPDALVLIRLVYSFFLLCELDPDPHVDLLSFNLQFQYEESMSFTASIVPDIN